MGYENQIVIDKHPIQRKAHDHISKHIESNNWLLKTRVFQARYRVNHKILFKPSFC